MKAALVVKKGSSKAQVIELRNLITLVGRMQGCDLRIPAKAVSRHHCKLRLKYDYVTVEDLDSANGTFVNGTRVEGKQTLRPGDQLQIGPVVFEVKYNLSKTGEVAMSAQTVTRKIEPEPVDSEAIELTVEDEDEADEPSGRDATGATPVHKDSKKGRTKLNPEADDEKPSSKKKKPKAGDAKPAKEKKKKPAPEKEPASENEEAPDSSAIMGDHPMSQMSGDDLRSLFSDLDDKK